MRVDRLIESFDEDDDEEAVEKKRELELQKKYICSWGCTRNNQHHVMEIYKQNLLKQFKSYCDKEKHALKKCCKDIKNYFHSV